MLSKKFFKHLDKVRLSPEYKETLQAKDEHHEKLLVQPHHRSLYRFFMNNTTGEATRALRIAMTAREKFKAMISDHTVELTVGGKQFKLTQ